MPDVFPKTLRLLIEQLPPDDRVEMVQQVDKLIKKIWERGYQKGYADGMEELIDEIIETPLSRMDVQNF